MKMELKHLLLYLGVLFTFIGINYSENIKSPNNSTLISTHHDDKDDTEDEFPKRGKNQGWSTWSEWSTCSRTCDGGVTFQLRRCHSPQGCRGDAVRYKICNMQACPEQQDFRAQQCAAYNDVPYDGALFKWIPHYDYSEPCALTCRGRPEHLPEEIPDTGGGYAGEDEPSVIVQLSNRVQDGTRCRPGSLDMCIQGKCQRVGCDLRIGSTKKIDSCGVCGGDSSTCSQPLYQWEIAPMSLCSVSCGGGYKMAMPTCRNRLTQADVEESLCNAASRPEPSVVQCNTHLCPPKWIADEWSPCTKVCGGGTRERIVVCAEESNGVKHRVPDEACRIERRPKITEVCNTHECPKWDASDWSGCSVSCGSGLQVRTVECYDTQGLPNTQCDPQTRPASVQPCSTGISCSTDAPLLENITDNNDSQLMKNQNSENEGNDQKENDTDNDSEDMEDSEEDDDKYLSDQPQIRALAYQFQVPRAERLVDPNVPNEATFVPDDWTPCTVSCGEGLRRRSYHCKIFLEFSRTIATIEDSKCHMPKPPDDVERCVMEPCSYAYGGYDEPSSYNRNNNHDRDQHHRQNNDQIKVQAAVPGKSYSWRVEGYTSCSASCLGGVEELIINCVRDDTGKVVSPYLCSPETKPENRIRTCNDIPCPPRWNYSEYTPCTKSCGIGIKTREINCIHEVTRGGENTMIVPNSMCPQPPPPDRQYCNVLDCPARWEVSEWSRCSKPCGGGYKNRTVLCKQTMAQDHKVGRNDVMCPSLKPPDRKPCNTKACAPEDQRPPIFLSNSTFIQHDPKKTKITLKVGGAASVFYGTQIKIKCPVKKYNRTKIKWSKDHNFLMKSRKFKISKKGALRILDATFKDAGVYTCHAGLSVADLRLTIKPKTGDFRNPPEDRHKDGEGHHGKNRHDPQLLTDNKDVRLKGKHRGRNKQRPNDNPSADDAMDDEEPFRSESQMTVSDSSSINPTTSSGSRTLPMPHFQHLLASLQFLWPFQTFSNSKGHHMLIEHKNAHVFDIHNREENDEPVKDFNHRALSLLKPSDDAVVLGSGTAEQLEFNWMITPWSECSQSCGINGSGFRLRAAHCMVKLGNSTQNVDNTLCEEAGLKIPETIEKCGNIECPRWKTSEWSLCQRSKCYAAHTALQKRDVSCHFGNDSNSNKCDSSEKPISKQECYNEMCKGVWRVEPWSQCNAECERQGIKYRILQCVWYGTKKPAGDACKNQPRPAIMKPCKGPQCIRNSASECKDIISYCKNVRTMGLCRLDRFQQQCCKTCTFNIYN